MSRHKDCTLPVSVEVRFWKYVKVEEGKCWPWQGSLMVRGGYGQLSFNKNGKQKLYKAHRVSYELHKGQIPDKLLICHKCNNSVCCNPEHLYAGTHKENWEDTKVDGKYRLPDQKRGEDTYNSKLTESLVIYIRTSDKSGADLSRELKVTRTLISMVRKRKIWKHV